MLKNSLIIHEEEKQKILATNYYAVNHIQNTNEHYELFPSISLVKINWNFKITGKHGHLNVFIFQVINTIWATDLYGIYKANRSKFHKDWSHILYLLHKYIYIYIYIYRLGYVH